MSRIISVALLTVLASTACGGGAEREPLPMGSVTSNVDVAEGKPFFLQPSVWGGEPPYSFSLLDGSLPPGVTLDPATGVMSGSPEAGMWYGFIEVIDARGNWEVIAFSYFVWPDTVDFAVPFIAHPPMLPPLTVGDTVSAQPFILAPSDSAPLMFEYQGLPPGVTFDPQTGRLSGRVEAEGAHRITMTVRGPGGTVLATGSTSLVALGASGGANLDCAPYGETYIGQFTYDYWIQDATGAEVMMTGAVDATLRLRCLGRTEETAVLLIESARLDESAFGCDDDCEPQIGIAAFPATPPTGPTNPSLDGHGLVLILGYAILITRNQAGSLSITSDARQITNTPTDDDAWVASIAGGPFPTGSDITRRSLKSFTLTASNAP